MNHVSKEPWGRLSDGAEVLRWTATGNRLTVSFISFGASVQDILFEGRREPLHLAASLPEAALYEKYAKGCIGATVGRYAGRIAGGRFRIDGNEYQLTRNQRGHHLHGGEKGFNTKVWEGEAFEDNSGAGVIFTLLSPDGEEGYPGSLRVSVRYTVTPDDCLRITFRADSDKDTVLNLTNHTYFNPNGIFPGKPHYYGDNRTVELEIRADSVLKLDRRQLPTGGLLPVDGTPFDFRAPKTVTRDMKQSKETRNGYDHTFVFAPHEPETPVAVVYGTKSGIRIECLTDQPGAQLFTMGNPGFALALEAQHFPDSPNHPSFPSTLLRAGEEFRSETVYRFSLR